MMNGIRRNETRISKSVIPKGAWDVPRVPPWGRSSLIQPGCALRASVHANLIAAQCFLDVVKGIANLRGKLLAGNAMNNVQVLSLRELHSATERLPQPDRRNMNCRRFVAHDVFDSAGAILLHDGFRNLKLPFVIYMHFVAKNLC